MSKGYEVQDLKLRPIVWAVIILGTAALVVHVQIWFMFDHWRQAYGQRDVRRTLAVMPEESPPEPRLETERFSNWEEYKRSRREILDSYGWTSREQEKVRIPIERAMEIMVETGK